MGDEPEVVPVGRGLVFFVCVFFVFVETNRDRKIHIVFVDIVDISKFATTHFWPFIRILSGYLEDHPI